MSDPWALLLLGALGVLTAFVERRDGWRFVQLAERIDRDLADVRERLARLEERHHEEPAHHDAAPPPDQRWWRWPL